MCKQGILEAIEVETDLDVLASIGQLLARRQNAGEEAIHRHLTARAKAAKNGPRIPLEENC